MSALIGHAKAARILGRAIVDTALTGVAERVISEESGCLLMALGQAHLSAALEMEKAMRAEATGNQGEKS